MLISFREAADLGLQMTLAVAVVIGGTAVATVASKGEEKPRQVLDLGRSALWEAGPIRIDRQEQLLTITVRPAATPDSQAANTLCSDAIGLRIACDLVATAHRPS